jgi:hypothetical protein
LNSGTIFLQPVTIKKTHTQNTAKFKTYDDVKAKATAKTIVTMNFSSGFIHVKYLNTYITPSLIILSEKSRATRSLWVLNITVKPCLALSANNFIIF